MVPGEDSPGDKKFDVVMAHAPTDDGEGARVLRLRPGQLEAGEVRPVREGKPLTPGGEVVRLERRNDASGAYDVHVEHKVETPPKPASDDCAAEPARACHGPAQVATQQYRDSWERTFGRRRSLPN
jgi:hypothetical protein